MSQKEYFDNLPLDKQNEIRERGSNQVKKGFAAEIITKQELEREGWEVIRLFKKQKTKKGYRSIFLFQNIVDFLMGTKRNGEKVADCLVILNSEGLRLPDFLCKRKGYVKFCEVKNNKNLINPEDIKQNEAIKRIWDSLKIETELHNLVLKMEKIGNLIADYLEKTGKKEGEIMLKEGEHFIRNIFSYKIPEG